MAGASPKPPQQRLTEPEHLQVDHYINQVARTTRFGEIRIVIENGQVKFITLTLSVQPWTEEKAQPTSLVEV